MKAFQTEIPDVLLIEPQLFHDQRGYFFESYNEEAFSEIGITERFRQDNQSCSKKGTIRGLHLQLPPFEQGKLVRVVHGAIFDVAVDIRIGSPWYGKWIGRELTGGNRLMLWVPPGFAHGFAVLEDDTLVAYKCTNMYDKASETSIRWDDPELAVDWGVGEPIVSEKDSNVPLFRDLRSPFIYVGSQGRGKEGSR